MCLPDHAARGHLRVCAAHDTHAFAEAMATLRASGCPLLPSISDDGRASGAVVADVLRNPASTTRHVWALVDLVRRHDFRGIEVRYAALGNPDDDGAVAFLKRLAGSLHAEGRRLAIGLGTDDAGTGRTVAAELDTLLDEVRIATYDYHWATSPPGPLAPVDWLRQELARVTRTIAAEKVVAGVPAAGYHWAGHEGTPISHRQATALASRRADGSAVTRRASRAGSPTPTTPASRTRSGSRTHTAWRPSLPSRPRPGCTRCRCGWPPIPTPRCGVNSGVRIGLPATLRCHRCTAAGPTRRARLRPRRGA